MRTLLYAIARAMGDYRAVRNGTVARRLKRRAAGRLIGRHILRRIR